MLKDLIVNKMIETNIIATIKDTGICPMFSDIYGKSTSDVDAVFIPSNIPSIGFKDIASASILNNKLSGITGLFNAITNSTTDIISEHQYLSNSYIDLSKRIDYELTSFKRDINALLNYSCNNIDLSYSFQTGSSNVGKIGSCITLPFFINNAQMYNDYINISAISDGELVFSNLSDITELPLADSPSIKVSSKAEKVNTIFTIAVNTTFCNMLYIKMLNDVINTKVILKSQGSSIYTSIQATNEILLNFEPLEIDSIILQIESLNVNTDKPIAIQIGAIEIFKEIIFAKTGTYESLPIDIGELIGSSVARLAHTDTNSILNTNIKQFLSLDSTTGTPISYNQVEADTDSDISLFKYKYGNFIIPASSVPAPANASGITKEFLKYIIPFGGVEGTVAYNQWNMNYQKAIIFYGLNRNFLSGNSADPFRYENWTLNNNYYKTFLLNFEDNIIVDIGAQSCKVDGQVVTGKIRLKKGISFIEIHTKDMMLPSGAAILDYYQAIAKPDNLLYSFTGMPDYKVLGPISDMITTTKILYGPTLIDLGESFMPFSETVQDANAINYRLQLTSSTNVPFTYSIEPNGGKIFVCPSTQSGSGVGVSISYQRAKLNKKPAGILFNRLLTFAPIDALISAGFGDNILFGFDGSPTERYIYLPSIPEVPVNSIQIMYNITHQNLYASAKLILESSNKYLTPIITAVSLTVV
jgi:hypothetical protein